VIARNKAITDALVVVKNKNYTLRVKQGDETIKSDEIKKAFCELVQGAISQKLKIGNHIHINPKTTQGFLFTVMRLTRYGYIVNITEREAEIESEDSC